MRPVTSLSNVLDWIIKILSWPPVLHVLILPGFVAALGAVIFIIWFERKAAARVQMRYGPLNISPRIGGFLQLIADLIRYALQEIIIPHSVDKIQFIIAPLLYVVLSVLPVAALPVTDNPAYYVIPPQYTLLVALMLSMLPGIFALLAAWASNNKFASIGMMREAYLITGYEIPILVTGLTVALMAGSLNMVDIVRAQWSTLPFMVLNPVAAIVFFITILISTSRFPFEIPEADQEIVAGPYTEYSALLYGINMGGSYIRTYIYSIFFALAFLGGWYPYEPGTGFIQSFLIPAIIVFIKATLLTALTVFMRAVFPRYRIDQALEYAWKYLFPLSLIGLLIGILEAMILPIGA